MTKKRFIESREYQESFSLLSRQDQIATLETLDFFFEQEAHMNLRNHTLREYPYRVRSISIHDDLRVLLQKRQDGGVYLMKIGNHDTVYKNL